MITLPVKLREKIEEESRKLGVSDEEFVVEALFEYLRIDPESKTDVHLALSNKYLKESEELVGRGDYVQASEKAWGAASQMVKALATKEGKELRSHGELHKYVLEIVKKIGDQEIRRFWQVATSLHQNFYENWLPDEIVRESIQDVKKFVEKLRSYVTKKEW